MECKQILPEFLYRYVEYRYGNQTSLEFIKYKILSETPCGYWIDENYPLRLDAPWIVNEETQDRKFVLKGDDGKRFAYITKEAALKGFIHRKKRQVKIVKAQMQRAKDGLLAGEILLKQLQSTGKDTYTYHEALVIRNSYQDNY